MLQLAENERVVSEALAISGLLAFTTFNPVNPERDSLMDLFPADCKFF